MHVHGAIWGSLALALVACADKDKEDDTGEVQPGVCVDGRGALSGTITGELSLEAGCTWTLTGGLFVGDGTEAGAGVLTIPAGTTVEADSATPSFLVVTQHSRIEAAGTADAPITFTTVVPEGSRVPELWGGLVLNGRAPVNACEGEGCSVSSDADLGDYGGGDPEDDSGTLQYVRVAWGGVQLSEDAELNGLALQGVGRGTTIENVHLHRNGDDGLEVLGGTVDLRRVLVTYSGDDGIDVAQGWTGRGQFLAVVQSLDEGEHGLEMDNLEDDEAASPITQPTLSHVTLVGQDGEDSELGLQLRRGTGGRLSNVVVSRFTEACVNIDDDASWALVEAEALTIDHSIFDCNIPYVEDDEDRSVEGWFLAGEGNELGDPGLSDPGTLSAPGLAPGSGALSASGGESPDDPWFEAASFRGAVGPDDVWTAASWLSFEEN